MSNSLDGSHTTGPWHWDSDPIKNDPTGRVRYRVTALGKTITQVYHSSFEGGPTNAEADARLIAAAPEMLAALKGCIEASDKFRAEHNVATESECLIAVRAAIAKAENK